MAARAKAGIKGIIWRRDSYWFSITVKGKRTWHHLQTADLSEAILRAADLRGQRLETAEHMRSEVERYMQEQRKSGQWTSNTLDSRGPVLRTLADYLGAVRPGAVTAKQLEEWLRTRKLSPSTQAGHLATLSGFWQWCIRSKIATHNPARAATHDKVKPAARKPFCPPELRDRIIAECTHPELKTALLLGFHAGLRRTEISAARPAWLDLGRKLLHVRKISPEAAAALDIDAWDLKDATERTIPMTGALAAHLGTLDLTLPYLVCGHKRHRGVSRYRYDIRRPFEEHAAQVAKKMGIEMHVTTHTMRHTFASLLVSAGVDIYTVAEWLGNDVRTTQKHYAGLRPRHDLIERAHQSSSPPD